MPADSTKLFNEWLVTDGVRAAGMPALIVGVAQNLNAIGFDLIRITVMVRTLHPEIESIRFGWTIEHTEIPPIGQPFFLKKRIRQVGDQNVEEISFSHGAFARSAPYQVSPYKRLEQGENEVHSPIKDTGNEFPILDDIRLGGGTDYFLFALPQIGDVGHRISFATRRPAGFSAEQLRFLRDAANQLAVAIELQVNRLITENLLAVYLGLLPAQKVLSGTIKPGDVEQISAAIWFSDLRGFTELSQVTESRELIESLNTYFETISNPIIENGGEILKYIGDAVLAIFPVENQDALAAAKRAFRAAQTANEAVRLMNEKRKLANSAAIHHGIALHIGDVQYGNIGANRRLDFTVIGPAVNKASRVESLCKETGYDLLMSGDFAAYISGAKEIGEYQLKGIAQPEKIFCVHERTAP
jgi:adenylate cyclase